MLEIIELLVIAYSLLWVAGALVAWFRYDVLPHGAILFVLFLIWPLLLFQDILRLAPWLNDLAPLIGFFHTVPVFMMVGSSLMLHPLLKEKVNPSKALPIFIICLSLASQIPFILRSIDDKRGLILTQPSGQLSELWGLYLPYIVSGVLITVLSYQLIRLCLVYQRTLSEQVVDVKYYALPTIISVLVTLAIIALSSVVMVLLVAFDVVTFNWWQSIIHLFYAGSFLVLIVLMLERRRYSPLPLNLDVLERRAVKDSVMRDALAKAEKTMINRKAYKVIGLKIRQLADAAEIDPTHLAVAIHVLLNRNFRAFVYHYRLEYAKKVLMRSDARVSAVAHRLGFDSDRFLSDMFVHYIEKMGVSQDPALPAPSRTEPLESSLVIEPVKPQQEAVTGR